MPSMNKGEWGEPYAALRILAEKKLFIADRHGKKNPHEWMDVISLIRNETMDRIVRYSYSPEQTDVLIYVNDDYQITIPVIDFNRAADKLAADIRCGRGHSFEVSDDVTEFLKHAEIKNIKAKSVDKSDIFLTVNDPRASVTRNHVGFSIKSEFGQPPTLFNTAKASAPIYKISGMDDQLMDRINNMFDGQGHAAVSDRCAKLISSGCSLEFVGFPYADRARCRAFGENLDLIDPRLGSSIADILYNHFFLTLSSYTRGNINDVSFLVNMLAERNPHRLTRPEIKYPYMFKSFIYAAYCGLTASTLWDGRSEVNGGFIRVKGNGEVLAFYALESDSFKDYLYDHCFFEYPATSPNHGNYASVYKDGDDYFFRLNFQIRYKIDD